MPAPVGRPDRVTVSTPVEEAFSTLAALTPGATKTNGMRVPHKELNVHPNVNSGSVSNSPANVSVKT